MVGAVRGRDPVARSGVSEFLPADDNERWALRGYLSRLLALDTRASVRLQAGGRVLGVWGGPPLDVVTLRPVALAQPSDLPDVTVSATRLLERFDPAEGADLSAPIEVPASVAGPAWARLLPPRSGWTALATVPAGAVHDAVRVGVEAFQRRVDLLPEEHRSRARLDAVAADVWGRPVVAGVPLRAAHAADLVGLLGRDGEVTALENGPWRRLSCPGGSVALRGDSGGPLDLFAL
jgi:hypothetical protein